MERSLFNEKHSLAIRLWHWTFFVFISSSVAMVILASTLFDTGDNVGTVQEEVARKGGSVTMEQARAVAHEFNDKLWMMHKYAGVGIAFLLLFRIIIEFAAKKEERLGRKIKRVLQLKFTGGEEQKQKRDYLLAKYGYLLFYLLIFVMVITGLALVGENVPFLKSIRRPVKSIHNMVQWGIYGYIFLHLAGVVLADVTHSKGIVSRMIHGKKDQ
ncbi:MAG TPA: cytochrome b/b6 domain-containing protein [Bacteroidia bacterium]|jgi:cytochrome b561